MSPTFHSLRVDIEGGVAVMTLTRPEVMNRFDDVLHVEFTEALAHLRSQRAVRSIVLASTGKVFSAGGDFALMEECHGSMASRLRIIDDGRRLLSTVLDVPQPIVVALEGDAIGLGASIVLCCDAVVAAPSAGIADPHVRLALVAGDGGCVAWPSSGGMLLAKRYLLTGDRMTAELAYRCGMVTDLVEDRDAVLPTAMAVAAQLAALPPLAVQGTKRALNRVLQQRAGEVVDLSFAHEVWTLGSDDLLEAIAAFKERRPGNYTGE